MQSSLAFLKQAEQRAKWDPPSLFKHTRADTVAMVTDLCAQFGSAGKGGR